MPAILLNARELRPGDEVAEQVLHRDGRLIAEPGQDLTQQAIERISAEGVRKLLVSRNAVEHPDTPDGLLIPQCVVCKSGMGLRKPADDNDVAFAYRCNGCDAVYYGIQNHNCRGLHCGPERTFCDRTCCGKVTKCAHDSMADAVSQRLPGIAELVAKLDTIYHSHLGAEHRASLRFPLDCELAAEPLDENFRVIGDACPATSVDVSLTGARIVTRAAANAAAYAVDYQNAGCPGLRLIFRVAWEREHGALHEVGGPFHGRICPVGQRVARKRAE